MRKVMSALWRELQSHLPYSAFATAAGIILAGLMLYVALVISVARPPAAHVEPAAAGVHEHARELEDKHDAAEAGAHGHAHSGTHEQLVRGAVLMQQASHVTFHVFHPIHMFFSAIATTAMFWRYERRLLKAVLVGLIGSLGVCSVSDIFMPFLSGWLLGAKEMTFHWCLVQHPMLVLPFALVGTGVGLLAAETVRRSTYFSHSAHVFVSSAASILYLVSFGLTDWAEKLGSVFILMLLAVTIPCCFSDIIFPLLVTCRDASLCASPELHDHGA